MHKVVNGKKVRLTQEEIAEIEADEVANLREEALYRAVIGRAEAFGNLSKHIERISQTLAHLKNSGVDLGADGDEQCMLIDGINQKYPNE